MSGHPKSTSVCRCPLCGWTTFLPEPGGKTTKVRKSGLTFAAEAGTQRLRNVINKNVTWDEIEKTCTIAFNEGYTSVKLYFMTGLPTETLEDIKGIAETAQKVVDLYYSLRTTPRDAACR